jgi:hypothetical protein
MVGAVSLLAGTQAWPAEHVDTTCIKGGAKAIRKTGIIDCMKSDRRMNSMLSGYSQKFAYLAQTIVLVFVLLAAWSDGGQAQRAGSAFARLAGHWAGSGTIDLSDGTHEPLRCRASYDLLSAQKVELNIRCASDSYNFDLLGSATLSGRSIGGSWSESTRSAAGSITGTAEGDRIQVHAMGAGFSADLTLVTRGARQSILIRTPDPSAGIKGATISLRQRG